MKKEKYTVIVSVIYCGGLIATSVYQVSELTASEAKAAGIASMHRDWAGEDTTGQFSAVAIKGWVKII